ncbi:hypothetical protein HK098_000399 [Nowakowskiella sp. JEL0407]|nr:hypothetical protein HK098_000399 [Nowakowskiella sp. JEL0407]
MSLLTAQETYDPLQKWKKRSKFRKGLATDIVFGDVSRFSKDSQFATTMKQHYPEILQNKTVDCDHTPDYILDNHGIPSLNEIKSTIPAGRPDGGDPYKSRFEQHIVFGDQNRRKFIDPRKEIQLNETATTLIENFPAKIHQTTQNKESIHTSKKKGTYTTMKGVHVGVETKADLPADTTHFNSFATSNQEAYTPHSAASIENNKNLLAAGRVAMAKIRVGKLSNIAHGDTDKERTISTVAMSSWKPLPLQRNEIKINDGRKSHIVMGDRNNGLAENIYTTSSLNSLPPLQRLSRKEKRTPNTPMTIIQMLEEKLDRVSMPQQKKLAYLRSKSSIVFGEEERAPNYLQEKVSETANLENGEEFKITKGTSYGMSVALKPDQRLRGIEPETCQKSHYFHPKERELPDNLLPAGSQQDGSINYRKSHRNVSSILMPNGTPTNFVTTAEASFLPPPPQEKIQIPRAGALITKSTFSIGDPQYETETSIISTESNLCAMKSIAQSDFIPHNVNAVSNIRTAGLEYSPHDNKQLIGDDSAHQMCQNRTTHQDHFVSTGVHPRVSAIAPLLASKDVMFPRFNNGLGPTIKSHISKENVSGEGEPVDANEFYQTTHEKWFCKRDGIYNINLDRSSELAAKKREQNRMVFGDPHFFNMKQKISN